jgi:glycosyltransferase involved in cell wall biosynthesis
MSATSGDKPRLRIALCKSHFQGPISGADETLVAYASELRRAGHDVSVVLLYPFTSRDNYARRLQAEQVRIQVIAERAWIFGAVQLARRLATHFLFVFVLLSRFPGHVRRIWQTILGLISGFYFGRAQQHFETHRYDVLHVLTPDPGTGVIVRAAKSVGVPVLYQELGTPYHMPGLETSYQRLARVTPLCDGVAALSPRLARQWSRKLPSKGPMKVLPLIVPPPVERRIPRRNMPFDLIFGFSGRLESGKGPMVLIEAFAEVHRQLGGVYLRIAGNGPETYKVRARVRELGLVDCCEFTGNYSGTIGRDAFLQTLDIFVLPTFAEGTPNSLIEAMSNGVPVVASGVGGIPDMITEDCGMLVPPGEAMALAKAMLKLARDAKLRSAMGSAGRKRYRALFSPEAVLPILTATYISLAKGPVAALEQGTTAAVASADHPWEAAA